MSKYPEVLAAVRKGDNAQWDIGDAVLAARSNKTIVEVCEDIAADLKEEGYEYSPDTLKDFRFTAKNFEIARRRAKVPFQSHREAYNPDMLDRIIDEAPDGQAITPKYVRKARKAILGETGESSNVSDSRADLSAIKHEFEQDGLEILIKINKMRDDIGPYIEELSKTYVNARVEELLQGAEGLRQLTQLLQSKQTKKGGHLYAIQAAE